MRSDALSHVRVLDLSRVLAGPWASQVLADLGAEVIKVERPGAGDETRAWGPPWLRDAQGAETRESAYFASTNRGKKSITLDLARPEGQAIVRRLAGRADVLLENYRVGALARHGPPIRLSETPVRRRAPPLLGEHTREVLVEILGMAEAEVEALRSRGVI